MPRVPPETRRDCLGPLNRRLVGISFDSLRRIPIRIGLAAGKDKATAVRAALRSGFVTALVVDEEIAEAVFNGG